MTGPDAVCVRPRQIPVASAGFSTKWRRPGGPRRDDALARDGAEPRTVGERKPGYLAPAARRPGRPVPDQDADAAYCVAAGGPKQIEEAIEWGNFVALGMGRGHCAAFELSN